MEPSQNALDYLDLADHAETYVFKEYKPHWIGQNFFLEYTNSLRRRPMYLECGESAVRFLNLSSQFGFKQWKKNIRDTIFRNIYPSILKGLYQIREKHPLLVKELLDMFCININIRLFIDVPDVQHLDFVLDVANQTCFDFSHYHMDKIISWYVAQGRCELVIKLLSYGYTIQVCSHIELFSKLHLNLLALVYNFVYNDLYKLDCKEMFRMLFLSLPFPFVSSIVQEIVLKDVDRANNEHVGNQNMWHMDVRQRKEYFWRWLIHSCETCGIPLPDYRVRNPRKLSHLCRCSIRKRLGDHFMLPTGIDALDIPTYLKDFLKFVF